MKKIKSVSISKILLYVFLFFLVLVTLLPIAFAFFGSFKSNMELLTDSSKLLPRHWTIENYIQAWEIADFKTYTWNSIWMSACSVIGVVFVSSMVGYVFARGKFRGKNVIFALLTSTMFISLGTITLYPTLQIAKLLHINKSLLGIVIIHILGTNVTNIFLVRGFINGIPKEIDEAAIIDGCSFFGVFRHIMLPLIKPILATISILSFKTAWNDYLLPMLFTVGNKKQMPLVVGVIALKSTGESAASWNLMLAGVMLSIIPMIVVYLFMNKYFVEGLTAGAVKG